MKGRAESASGLAPSTKNLGESNNLRNKPAVLVEGAAQRQRIVVANAAARSVGIRAGQALASACALHSALAISVRDRDAEQHLLTTLADWAYRFSAEVSVVAPCSLLLEVGASLALFGGWPALERRLRDELAQFGFAWRLAGAPIAAAAQVLARNHDGPEQCGPVISDPIHSLRALGTVALRRSGLDVQTSAALQGMGFSRLDEVFRLPRPELARRIGTAALDHLDRLRGLLPEALPLYRPPTRYRRRLEFDYRIDNCQALLFPLQRLLREFALFLAARDGGVQQFELVLEHDKRALTRIPVGLLAPQSEAAALLEFARGRLERVQLPAAVNALTLVADDLPTLAPLHHDLFENTRRQISDWPALAERLRARLGDDVVHGLACVADHRPSYGWRLDAQRAALSAPASGAGKTNKSRKQSKHFQSSTHPHPTLSLKERAEEVGHSDSDFPVRPFWLLPRAIPLRPAPARILAGPERIEAGWWDGDDQRRDYYIVQTPQGQRAWAFVAAGARDGWMLHGWFA
ncbi:MAG: DNA polymerase Y family protein [Dokdonella sp.]